MSTAKPIPGRVGNDTVVITAYGVIASLTASEVSTTLRANIKTKDAMAAILEDVGIPVGQRGVLAGDTVMAKWWADTDYAIDAVREVEKTEFGYAREQYVTDTGPKFVFESGQHRLTGARRNSRLTLSDNPAQAGAYPIIDHSLVEDEKDIANYVRAPVRTFRERRHRRAVAAERDRGAGTRRPGDLCGPLPQRHLAGKPPGGGPVGPSR